MEGWAITEWSVAGTAILTFVGLIWRKVVRPVIRWGQRIERATVWTEQQMRPNGGSTLVDKVDMLLRHDAERDRHGLRYGDRDDPST